MRASVDNRHFLLRRLHSLLGVVPVGAFLIFHLWENSQSRFGATHYNQEVVGALQGINYLPFVELFAITLPLLFHAGYGLLILRESRPRPLIYPFLHNRLYLLQRISGVATLAFLIVHVGWTRLWASWEPAIHADLFGHMRSLLTQPFGLTLYGLGLMLAVFHLCYGLWTFSISWGVTTSPRAQRIAFNFCAALAALLTAMGFHGLAGFLG